MSDVLKNLLDRKGRLGQEIRTFAEEAENNGWTAEDNEKWDRLNADYDAADKRAEELHRAQADADAADEQRAPYERTVRAQPNDPARARRDKEVEQELRDFLDRKTPAMDFDFTNLERERRDNGSYEIRDLTEGVAAAGGTTVPRNFERQLYRHLIDASGLRQTNVRIDTTPDGAPKVYPRTASHGTAAIVGEGTALAENDPTFSAIELGAWKYGQLLQISNELISDTTVDLQDYIAQQAGMAVAYATENKYVNGTGTNEPYGAFVGAGTAVTGATGGTGVPSIANLIDTQAAVPVPYRKRGASWVMRPSSAAYIRKVAIASTAPEGTWGTNLQSGQPDTLLGDPLYTSPFAAAYGTPAKPIVYGDWSTFVIRDVRGIRFERSDDFAFDKDMVTFRAILRTDSDFLDFSGLTSFCGPST